MSKASNIQTIRVTNGSSLMLVINRYSMKRMVLAHREPQGGGGLPNVGYTGMCHRPGSIFHLQKSRTGPKFLKFYSRTGPTFWSFTPEKDPFLTIWSPTPGSNVKNCSCFRLLFPAAWCLHFCFAKCFKLSKLGSGWVRTYVFLFEFNMISPLWITFNVLGSSEMNKEYWVKSE